MSHGHSHGGQACHGHGEPAAPAQHGHSHAGGGDHGHSHGGVSDHGHSHGGQPCHGHSAPQPQPAQHGHSHGGQPCHGHGGAAIESGAGDSDVCSKCGKGGAGVNLSRCSRCKSVFYCGRECQTADWKEHKKVCSA